MKFTKFWLLCINCLFLLPLGAIVLSSASTFDTHWQHLIDTVLTGYITNSLLLSLGVGLLCLPFGVMPAWLVTMYHFPGRRYFEWMLLLPIVIPAYVVAYTYTGLFDISGPLQSLLRQATGWDYGTYWFPEPHGLLGAIMVISFVLYPYIYLLARAAFSEQSTCVLEVSRSLGLSAKKIFWQVGLPLARPAIMVGLALIIMECLADYGAVQHFGVPVFTTGIFRSWFATGSSAIATQLATLLVLFVMILVGVERHSRQKERYHHTSNRYSRIQRITLHGMSMVAAVSTCLAPLILGFIIPISMLILWASSEYQIIWDHSFIKLIFHSIVLAASTAILGLLLALIMIYANRYQRSKWSDLTLNIISMGYALPGVVIAIGVLIAFSYIDQIFNQYIFSGHVQNILTGSLAILIFAYLVRFLTIPIKTVQAAALKIKPSIDEVARTFKYKKSQIVAHVHIPIMSSSLLTAVLLVFIDTLKELPLTLILRPLNFNTLAVHIYELANEELLSRTAMPALALVLTATIPMIFISRWITRTHDNTYSN